jgi:hypothetical protein
MALWLLRQGKAARKLADLLLGHGWPMLAQHISEVLGKSIDLLLQKKEGRLDGTQLSFVNNKGEWLHLNLSVANHVHPR